MSSAPTKPRVVVVGGGFAGAAIAKGLEGKTNVTLVSDRDFMFVKYGALRAGVRGGTWTERTQIPLDRLFKKGGVFVKGAVARVDAASKIVVLEDGRSLPYDALVCATGSRARGSAEPPVGRSKEDFKAWFDMLRASIASAKSVVVVGGGPIGFELAGEVRAAFPDKKLTLVAGKAGLMGTAKPAFAPKFIAALQKKLADNGVQLENDNVDSPAPDPRAPFAHPADGVVRLASGKTIAADLVLFGVGVELRTSIYPAEWLDPSTGELVVEPTHQVRGQSHVFAAGDVAKTGRAKLGYLAFSDAGVVVPNVLAVLAGKTPTKKTPPPAPVMVVPFGHRQGVAAMPGGFVAGDWLTSKIKSRGLFANMMWGQLVGGAAPVPEPDETR